MRASHVHSHNAHPNNRVDSLPRICTRTKVKLCFNFEIYMPAKQRSEHTVSGMFTLRLNPFCGELYA